MLAVRQGGSLRSVTFNKKFASKLADFPDRLTSKFDGFIESEVA
jgi:hypothetical protein